MQKTFLENLQWRFATKQFDPDKKISEEDLAKILDAIRFAPTSYGLQQFHVVVVTDAELRKKLRTSSYLQEKVTDSSHLLVFCARNDINERADEYVRIAWGGKLTTKVMLEGMKVIIKKVWGGKPEEARFEWATRQAYLALGFALAACAELGIDSCPMEGFQSDKYDYALGLPKHMRSVVLLPIGYRKEGPEYPKVRFPKEDLFSFK
jgi:nitroreductase